MKTHANATNISTLSFATKAIHAGQSPDPTTGAIMTPIYQTSTYVQESPGQHKGYEYARTHNLTRASLENNIAALEQAKYGLCFSSGCAAMMNVLHTLKSGDHVVVCDDVYGGTHRLFSKCFPQLGIQSTFVDLTRLENLDSALKAETKLIWIETPTNPLLKLIDIEAISKKAALQHIPVLVDNTFASPYLQNPLTLGATYVLHSTTKYMGGHSDVVGGFVGMNDTAIYETLKFYQNALGAIPAPMDCFLLLRGTKTLHVRMDRHCDNAQELAGFLSQHASVERVIYPGREDHPQFALAKRQMKRPGGMLCFVVKGGLEAAKKVLSRVQLFACAESLGGVESLIEHPGIMTHGGLSRQQRENLGIVDGLIRVSVGIEDVNDLKKDLNDALAG